MTRLFSFGIIINGCQTIPETGTVSQEKIELKFNEIELNRLISPTVQILKRLKA